MAEAERSSRGLLYPIFEQALVGFSMTRSRAPWEPGSAVSAAPRRRGPVCLSADQEHDREEDQKDGKCRKVNGHAKG